MKYRKEFGIRACAFCGASFEPHRFDQRFDKRECHDQFYNEERKRALAAYRVQPSSFFINHSTSDVQDEEIQPKARRTG